MFKNSSPEPQTPGINPIEKSQLTDAKLPSIERVSIENRNLQEIETEIKEIFSKIVDFRVAFIDASLSGTKYNSYTTLQAIVERLRDRSSGSSDDIDRLTTLRQALSDAYEAIKQSQSMVQFLGLATDLGINFTVVEEQVPHIFQLDNLAQRPPKLFLEIGEMAGGIDRLKAILSEGISPTELSSAKVSGSSTEPIPTFLHIKSLGVPMFIVHRSPSTISGDLFLRVDLEIEDDGVRVFTRTPKTNADIVHAFNIGVIFRSLISNHQLTLMIKSKDDVVKESYDAGIANGEEPATILEEQRRRIAELSGLERRLLEQEILFEEYRKS